LAFVKEKQKLTSPEPDDVWTRPETYLGVLLRTHSFRRAHREKPRTQPEAPRAMLSTIPFLILLALLAVLAVAIMIIAFPGNQPVQRSKPPTHQPGVAERGWFQEAQKEMHR
jgi:hypothetical protein